MRTTRFQWKYFVNLWLLLCFAVTIGRAQVNLNVSQIPSSLLTDAHAVIRYDETSFDLISKSEAKLRRHIIVTILNEQGEENHNRMVVGYDKFTKISDLEGAIYDHTGKLLKKLRNSDISDFGYGASSDMITDARWKVAEFGKKSYPYPYTIEFSYETRDRNMMFYPSWTPVNDAGTAVERADFKVKVPAGLQFRYKVLNSVPDVQKTTDKDNATVYTWSMKNVPPDPAEEYALPGLQSYPAVLTAPYEFELQDYSGNFTNWTDLGTFYNALNQNRDKLPEATIAQIKELTKNATSDREKVRMIYEWMQARTRYVSIQLGIGGWQTIDAMTVATKGYGDCKALSNFTVALLKQVGITGYTALIKAGSGAQIIPDFPSNQFNHAIACVPLDKDTIWLECTSQVTPTDYMGSFTGNRHALLITPQGGKLVKTRSYHPADNLRSRRTSVKLDNQGNGRVSIQTTYAGIQQEAHSSIINSSSDTEKRKWLLNNLSIAGLDLTGYQFQQQKGARPSVEESLDVQIRQLASKTGTRMFLKPNFLIHEHEVVSGTTSRTSDFYLNPEEYNFVNEDSLTIEIPAGYSLETTLPASSFKSRFGSYETSSRQDNNLIRYYRKLMMQGGRFPASDYKEWTDFLKKIRRADRAQIVLVEKKE